MDNKAEPTLYEVLGIENDADKEAIKKAYYALSLTCHPDKLADSGIDPTKAAEKLEQIQEAYDVLVDNEKRKIYDDKLEFGEGVFGEMTDVDATASTHEGMVLVTHQKFSINKAIKEADMNAGDVVKHYRKHPKIIISLLEKNKVPLCTQPDQDLLTLAEAHPEVASFVLRHPDYSETLKPHWATLACNMREAAVILLTKYQKQLSNEDVFKIYNQYHDTNNEENDCIIDLFQNAPTLKHKYEQFRKKSISAKTLCDPEQCRKLNIKRVELTKTLTPKQQKNHRLIIDILKNPELIFHPSDLFVLAHQSIQVCEYILYHPELKLGNFLTYQLFKLHPAAARAFQANEPFMAYLNLMKVREYNEDAKKFLQIANLDSAPDVELLCQHNPCLIPALIKNTNAIHFISAERIHEFIKYSAEACLFILQDPAWLVKLHLSPVSLKNIAEYCPWEVAQFMLNNAQFHDAFDGRLLYEVSKRHPSILPMILHNETLFERLKNYRNLVLHTSQPKVNIANNVTLQDYFREQKPDPAERYYQIGLSYWTNNEHKSAVMCWLFAIVNHSTKSYLELCGHMSEKEHKKLIAECVASYLNEKNLENFCSVGFKAHIDDLKAESQKITPDAIAEEMQKDPIVNGVLHHIIRKKTYPKALRFQCAITLARACRRHGLHDVDLKYLRYAEEIAPDMMVADEYYHMAHYFFCSTNLQPLKTMHLSPNTYFERLKRALPYFKKANNLAFIDMIRRDHFSKAQGDGHGFIDALSKQPASLHLLSPEQYAQCLQHTSKYRYSQETLLNLMAACQLVCEKRFSLNNEETAQLIDMLKGFQETARKHKQFGQFNDVTIFSAIIQTALQLNFDHKGCCKEILQDIMGYLRGDPKQRQDQHIQFMQSLGEHIALTKTRLAKLNQLVDYMPLGLQLIKLNHLQPECAEYFAAQFALQEDNVVATVENLYKAILLGSTQAYRELVALIDEDAEYQQYAPMRLKEILIDQHTYHQFATVAFAQMEECLFPPHDPIFKLLNGMTNAERFPDMAFYANYCLYTHYQHHHHLLAMSHFRTAERINPDALCAEDHYQMAMLLMELPLDQLRAELDDQAYFQRLATLMPDLHKSAAKKGEKAKALIDQLRDQNRQACIINRHTDITPERTAIMHTILAQDNNTHCLDDADITDIRRRLAQIDQSQQILNTVLNDTNTQFDQVLNPAQLKQLKQQLRQIGQRAHQHRANKLNKELENICNVFAQIAKLKKVGVEAKSQQIIDTSDQMWQRTRAFLQLSPTQRYQSAYHFSQQMSQLALSVAPELEKCKKTPILLNLVVAVLTLILPYLAVFAHKYNKTGRCGFFQRTMTKLRAQEIDQAIYQFSSSYVPLAR